MSPGMSPTASDAHERLAPPAVCPHAHLRADADEPRDAGLMTSAELRPDDELVLPLHRRVVTHRTVDASGAPELQLFAGDKEISFDEPDLFAFGDFVGGRVRLGACAAAARASDRGRGAGARW